MVPKKIDTWWDIWLPEEKPKPMTLQSMLEAIDSYSFGPMTVVEWDKFGAACAQTRTASENLYSKISSGIDQAINYSYRMNVIESSLLKEGECFLINQDSISLESKPFRVTND